MSKEKKGFRSFISEHAKNVSDRMEANKVARKQGNIKRDNEKQAELREKGSGYYWEKIKTAILSVVWFIPNVIAYVIHGRILNESTDHDIDKANDGSKQQEDGKSKDKSGGDKEQEKGEQTKETLKLEGKKLENCGLKINGNELVIDGAGYSCQLTPEMIKDPDIIEQLSKQGFIAATETLQVTEFTVGEGDRSMVGSGFMETNLIPDQGFKERHYFTDQSIQNKLRELDKTLFMNKLNVSMFISKLREDQGYIEDNGQATFASFKFNDVVYSITKDLNSGEMTLSDEAGNKVSLSNTSQDNVYDWVKSNNERNITFEEVREIFNDPDCSWVKEKYIQNFKEQEHEKDEQDLSNDFVDRNDKDIDPDIYGGNKEQEKEIDKSFEDNPEQDNSEADNPSGQDGEEHEEDWEEEEDLDRN